MKKGIISKNPCKLCHQSVTKKTGLQCKGACKRWAHFTCLNYTPGRIQDIKAGIITIACPCPTCHTAEIPKEFLTNPPFTCENFDCPAYMRDKCDNIRCPVNNVNSNPKSRSIDIECPSGCMPTESMHPRKSDHTPPPTQDQQYFDQPRSPNGLFSRKSAPDADRPSEKRGRSCKAQGKYEDKKTERAPEKDRKVRELSERFNQRSADDLKCCSPKVGNSFERLSNKKQRTEHAKSCSCVSMSKADKNKSLSHHSSCEFLNKDSRKALLCNIQQLCSTVGHLSSQVKQLMCKMMD